PVKYSVLPDILRRAQLVSANALMEAGRYLAILLGTLLGTALAASARFGTASVFYTLFFVSLFGFLVTLLFDKQQPAAPKAKINANVIKSTAHILKKVYSSRKAFLTIMAIAWFWVLGAVLLSQLPELSANTLHANSKVFNYLLALFAFGIGLGALACRKLLKTEITIKYLPISALLMSVALIDLAFAVLSAQAHAAAFGTVGLKTFVTTFAGLRVSADLFIISFCAGLYIVPLNASLQAMGVARGRSRLFGASNFINAVLMAGASALSSLLLWLGFGTPVIILLLALCNLAVALYIITLLPGYVVRSVLFFGLKTFYDIRVKGLENYQKAGKRAVIVANNNSFLDPILLAAFLPDDLTFVVDSTIAKRFWVRQFLRYVKHFAVDPTNPMAVKTIIEEIKKGTRIVLYPEGRISTTGGVMKVYPGPAMIADRSGADIIPIFMQNTQYSRFAYYGRKLRHLPDVPFVINIMEPVRLDLAEGLKGKDRRYKAEDKVYDLLVDMKFRSGNIHATLFRSLLEVRDFAGGKVRALEDASRKGLTYPKIITGSFALGHQFAKLAKRGEVIGVMLPNTNVCAVTLFALMAYGRVPAMINFSSGIRNILSACRAAQIKKIICAKLFVEMAELHHVTDALTKAGVEVIYLEDISKGMSIADKLRALGQSLLPYRAYKRVTPKHNPDEAAIILFTSGSEGTPKGVVLSHTNINACRCQLSSIIQYGLQDKFFNALPMFHSFGLVCGLFMPLLSGSGVFLYPSPLHYKIIPELVYDRNATVIFGTDTFLAAYGKSAHPYDFYNIRYAAVGAEKLKDETFKLWSEKFGIRVLEAYGATECAPGIAFTTPMHFKRGTVGHIFPGLEHRLEPVPGLEDGGRLIVKGPNVMLGYLKEDKPGVLQPPVDGWYDTGDIISFDGEGYIQIKGRVKRFAKIAGEMVSLL
ncbi:MAG: AMP-binding protein, partial [Elusimicrobiota bacterium]|nr:AMP-binding protein [Elusimicrobiota bacterium]